MKTVDIGIEQGKRSEIAQGLGRVLADTYVLYLKTHGFHWNVTGPQFNSLHAMFETQYQELAEAVDLLAERIRALGVFAPGSYAQLSRLASIEEETGTPPANEMIRQLVGDHEALARTIRSALPEAQAAHDEGTVNLLEERLSLHEKTAWMLRALLG
ncbi:MAG: Dps family protein [Planctomycetota bacterium]